MGSIMASAGNSGPKVRSDCEISIEMRSGGGIRVDLESRVKTLYGKSISDLCRDIIAFFGISDAHIVINDSGALPFVIAARVEAAIKKLIDTDKEFLPSMLRENTYSSSAIRIRFSRLYVPGNTPGMMINSGLHSACGIILDLEDSVATDRKDEARVLVRNALHQIDFRGAERMVRINQGERGFRDLQSIVPHNVNLILIPKCENKDHVNDVEGEIERIRKKKRLRNPVFIMPIIESPLGVENAFEIAKSSGNIVAVAIGLEDYTSELGVPRSQEGKESFYARTRIVNAAKAAGIQPIDSVFSDVADMDSLKQYAQFSKSLGFEGIGCIHPRQVPVVNRVFAPDDSEIEKSKQIIIAFEEARRKGLNVVALGSKMIDPPVVARAQENIDLALKLGRLKEGWREESSSETN